jgi:hypothetical protein
VFTLYFNERKLKRITFERRCPILGKKEQREEKKEEKGNKRSCTGVRKIA